MTGLIALMQKTKAAMDDLPIEKKGEVLNLLVSLSKRLLDQINVAATVPDSFHQTTYPAIQAQLQAADKRTERAVDQILGAMDHITSVLSKADPAIKTEVQKQVNIIFEAASFQDLVSQHLNEVRLQIDDLAVDIDKLQHCFDVLNGSDKAERTSLKTHQKRSDAHLLNGPSTNI